MRFVILFILLAGCFSGVDSESQSTAIPTFNLRDAPLGALNFTDASAALPFSGEHWLAINISSSAAMRVQPADVPGDTKVIVISWADPEDCAQATGYAWAANPFDDLYSATIPPGDYLLLVYPDGYENYVNIVVGGESPKGDATWLIVDDLISVQTDTSPWERGGPTSVDVTQELDVSMGAGFVVGAMWSTSSLLDPTTLPEAGDATVTVGLSGKKDCGQHTQIETIPGPVQERGHYQGWVSEGQWNLTANFQRQIDMGEIATGLIAVTLLDVYFELSRNGTNGQMVQPIVL